VRIANYTYHALLIYVFILMHPHKVTRKVRINKITALILELHYFVCLFFTILFTVAVTCLFVYLLVCLFVRLSLSCLFVLQLHFTWNTNLYQKP